MSQTQKKQEYLLHQQKCEILLQEPEIRFAGLIDSMGHLVAGGMKKGLTPLEDQEDRRKMFMELILRVTTRQEFDSTMGRVKYSASRREKIVMMSFPLEKEVLLVSAKPDVDIEKTAKKVMTLCNI